MAVINIGVGRLTKGAFAPVMLPGTGSVRSVRQRLSGLGRLGQFVGQGADQANCPSGQWNSNLNVCCAPAGTPAVDDPCSIFNQPAYLATQATATEQAMSGSSGPQVQDILESVSGYDQNVQVDAINCVSNPGLTFTDNVGQVINCPAPYTLDNGIKVSIYNAQQIASMLSGSATPAITAADNAPDNTLDAAAPTTVTVTPTAQTNALSNSAAQTASQGTPTQQQISGGQNVTGNTANAQGGATPGSSTSPASDVTVGGVDITSWIEQNWVLLAAGAAALLILPGLMKGR